MLYLRRTKTVFDPKEMLFFVMEPCPTCTPKGLVCVQLCSEEPDSMMQVEGRCKQVLMLYLRRTKTVFGPKEMLFFVMEPCPTCTDRQ